MPWNRLRQRRRCLHCREVFRGAATEVMLAGGQRGQRSWRWYAVELCAACADALESSVAPKVAEQLLEHQELAVTSGYELECVAAYHSWQGSPWNHLG